MQRKPAEKVVPFKSIKSGSIVPPDPPTGNAARPKAIERTDADARKSPFLDCTRRDIFKAFLMGTTERLLADTYGSSRIGVGRVAIEAAIRETAIEERKQRLDAERRLRSLGIAA